MTSRFKYVIPIWILVSLFAGMTCLSANAQTYTISEIDSVFVIASSGEVRYRDMVQPAIDSLAAMGSDIVPQLIDKFTTKSARERLTIIQILKKIGSPSLQYLIPALSRPEPLVVQRVCWALGDVRDTAAVNPLINISSHASWQVREKAVDALGKLKDNRADGTAISSLTDSVGQVRKAAAVAIGRLGTNDAIRELTSVLGDEFYGARMSAMESLVKLDSSEVIWVLSDSMISANELVGHLACRVLGQIATDEARDILLLQVETGSVRRRAHAAVAIVASDPEDQCGFHQQILEYERDRLVRIQIESAIKSADSER